MMLNGYTLSGGSYSETFRAALSCTTFFCPSLPRATFTCLDLLDLVLLEHLRLNLALQNLDLPKLVLHTCILLVLESNTSHPQSRLA